MRHAARSGLISRKRAVTDLREMKSLPFWMLCLVGLLSAAIWRIEIEARWGWAGLDWAAADHIAAPIIALLFSGWLCVFAPCKGPRARLGRSAAAFGGGFMCYVLYAAAFPLFYPRFGIPLLLYVLLQAVVFVVIPLCPCFLAWKTSPGFRWEFWFITPIMFALSFPISIFILWLIDHPGGADMIHAIKSGFIFVGFVISAGLPFIAVAKLKRVILHETAADHRRPTHLANDVVRARFHRSV